MYNKTDRRAGFYWIEGKPFVSVTKVLEVINKPQLMNWFGKMVYYAVVKDPAIQLDKALLAPYETSGKAMSRGSAVHSVIEAWKAGTKVAETTPELQPFVNAFWTFAEQNHLTVISQEKTVISKKYGYAGTLDLFVKMNGNPRQLIVDIKTNKDGAIYDEAFLQNSAYAQALREEGQTVDGIAVVALSEKGKFSYKEGEENLDAFLNAKGLWEWKNKEMIEKLSK